MRSSSKIFAIALATLGLCSCEEYFELKGAGGQPKMYVECYAGLSDTTFLTLYKAVHVNGKRSDAADFTIKSMSLTVDGVPVSFNADSAPLLFSTTTAIPAGSKLEFTLETGETAPVSASTVVPDKPVFTVEQKVINTPGNFIRFRQFIVKFPGGFKEGEHYGVSIGHHVIYEHSDSAETWDTYYVDPPITLGKADDSEAGTTQSVSLVVMGYPEEIRMATFSADDYPEGSIAASIIDDFFIPDFDPGAYEGIEIPEDEGGEGDEIPEESDETVVTHQYRVLVYKLSTETFGYFGALYNQQSNFLAMLGLSAPNYAYTNISGGYGILGALTVAESPWITPEI